MGKTSFNSLAGILSKYEIEEKGQRRISREWQDYAYRLAVELDDIVHTSLYMRMCKNVPRYILEEARVFIKGSKAKSKARLYMWKVKQLKEEYKGKNKRDII